MNGFVKLHASILDSTVWRESKETKILWITMLAMADQFGIVEASVPGLSDRARITREETDASLAKLSGPDPDSRSPGYAGARIRKIDGGWRILNYGNYRQKQSPGEKAAYQRAYMAKYRAQGRDRSRIPRPAAAVTEPAPSERIVRAGKNGKESSRVNGKLLLGRLGHADADADAESGTESLFPVPPKPPNDAPAALEVEKKKTPSSPEAKKIAALFRRRPTTAWSDKEIRAFKAIGKLDPEELDLVCRYTEASRKAGGFHRHDLRTFCNNYQGELDRARQWEANPSQLGRNGSHPQTAARPKIKMV